MSTQQEYTTANAYRSPTRLRKRPPRDNPKRIETRQRYSAGLRTFEDANSYWYSGADIWQLSSLYAVQLWKTPLLLHQMSSYHATVAAKHRHSRQRAAN